MARRSRTTKRGRSVRTDGGKSRSQGQTTITAHSHPGVDLAPWLAAEGDDLVCGFPDGKVIRVPFASIAGLYRFVGPRATWPDYHNVVSKEGRTVVKIQTKERPHAHGFLLEDLVSFFGLKGIHLRTLDAGGRLMPGFAPDPDMPSFDATSQKAPWLGVRLPWTFGNLLMIGGFVVLLIGLVLLFVAPVVGMAVTGSGGAMLIASLAAVARESVLSRNQ
jgi:hypothetical protein